MYPGGYHIVSRYPTYGAQCWRPKEYKGTYYMPCDYTTDRVDLLKSTDMLNWEFVSTIMSGGSYPKHKPTETEILFLEDGRCIAFIRMNGIKSPTSDNNTLPGFAISSPPYTSWDFTLGAAYRFSGQAAHLFGDTIVVASRAKLGTGPGYWEIPGEPEGFRTILYTFDLKTMRLEFQALLPTEHYYDTSYCGILQTGKDTALVSWYDGDVKTVSNIWLAHIRIV